MLKDRIDRFPTHLIMTLIWVVLAVPTVLVWNQSILWIGFMSVYAIIISHWTSHQAWKAERAAKNES